MMANIEHKQLYRCSDDCLQEGCPGHEAILRIQTCSDAYCFIGTNEKKIYFERNELQAFLNLLAGIDRADIVKWPKQNQ